MTTAVTTSSQSGISDAPIADAGNGFGPTEVAHYLVILAGFLGSTTGNTFGLDKYANNLAPLLILVGVVSLGLYRGIKHHGAARWNAQVYMSQLEHVAQVVVAEGAVPGTAMAKLTLGLKALNGGIQAALVPAGEGGGASPTADVTAAAPTPVDATPPVPDATEATVQQVASMLVSSGPPDAPVATP